MLIVRVIATRTKPGCGNACGNVIDVLFGHIEDDLDPALHFQRIAQWGSCGKAPVVPQNRPPGPAIADRIDANHA